jgi:hypothetical protein
MKLSHEDLERLVHRSLREIPDRRAPRTLESRVLAELQRRASIPWWRKSYAHWPAFARGAFLVASAGFAAAVVALLFNLVRGAGAAELGATVSQRFGSLALAGSLWNLARQTGETVLYSIPTLWLYGSLALIAVCYATVVGVGATAYRVFVQKAQ